MPSCNGASGYTSCTFAAPPGTAATIRAICSSVRSTRGSISGVRSVVPSGTRRAGTSTGSGPATAASEAGVGVTNNARTETEIPRRRSHSTTETASSEWPPSAKKSSSTPTEGRSSTAAKARHSSSSRAFAGARPPPGTYSGAGRAARSTFPLGVRGRTASSTSADGTREDGRRSATYSRTTSVIEVPVSAGTT